MAANKDDKFKKVGRSTATTLSSPGYTIGNTSINVASTANWPTDTGVTFAVDEVDADGVRVNGTYNIFKGVVSSATQISSVEYVGGDANRDYSAGATTRVYIDVDYSRHNELVDGLLAEHNQDGTHSDVTTNSIVNAGDISQTDTSSITDDSSNELIKFSKTASAVNEVTVKNAATGNAPQVQATGDDTNIDLNLVPKGTGEVTKSGNPIDWWEEIGRTTLTSAGDTITVSSLPARKYLKVIFNLLTTGGNSNGQLTFNNDSGSNYAFRASVSGASDSTGVSQAYIGFSAGNVYMACYEANIRNTASARKAFYMSGTAYASGSGAGTAPVRVELSGLWDNTSDQISRIDFSNTAGTGDLAIGAEIIVLGHD